MSETWHELAILAVWRLAGGNWRSWLKDWRSWRMNGRSFYHSYHFTQSQTRVTIYHFSIFTTDLPLHANPGSISLPALCNATGSVQPRSSHCHLSQCTKHRQCTMSTVIDERACVVLPTLQNAAKFCKKTKTSSIFFAQMSVGHQIINRCINGTGSGVFTA